MTDNISPEEKLLRLIKQNKKPAPEILPPAAKNTVYPQVKEAVDQPNISFPSAAKFIPLFNLKYLTLSAIQNIMIGIIIISCLYLAGVFIYSWFGLKKINLPTVSAQEAASIEPQVKEEAVSLESYTQAVKGRQIFSALNNQSDTVTSVVAADALKNFSLVGVVATGASAQAVIEDKKAQKTFYVNKGQFIGEYQVEDISEGKVILNYNGQRYELNM